MYTCVALSPEGWQRHGYWALVESYRSSRAPRQRVWPTSGRWMRQGVWAFTNKPPVLPLLLSADCSGR